MYELRLNLDLFALLFLPQSILLWLSLSFGVGFATFVEKGERMMPRITYLFAVVLRIAFTWVIAMLVGYVSSAVAIGEVEATGVPFPAAFEGVLATSNSIVYALWGVVATRIVIWRLRDAGIDTRLAFLGIVPIVNGVMVLGLILWPPSRADQRRPSNSASAWTF